jgi:hypothetical protein
MWKVDGAALIRMPVVKQNVVLVNVEKSVVVADGAHVPWTFPGPCSMKRAVLLDHHDRESASALEADWSASVQDCSVGDIALTVPVRY